MTTVPTKSENAKDLILWENPEMILDTLKDDDSVIKLIALVRVRASDQPFDMDTAKGRQAIISTGESVRKTRILIEAKVKERAGEIKKAIDAMKGRGERITSELNTLIAEIRRPVEEFNEKEDLRKKVLLDAIQVIRGLGSLPFNIKSSDVKYSLEQLALPDPTNWQEFAVDAQAAKDAVHSILMQALPKLLETEAMAAKLAELEAEKVARAQRDNPELPAAFVAHLIAVEADKSPGVPYVFADDNRTKFGYSASIPAYKTEDQKYAEIRDWLINEAGANDHMADYLINSLVLGEFPHVQLKGK